MANVAFLCTFSISTADLFQGFSISLGLVITIQKADISDTFIFEQPDIIQLHLIIENRKLNKSYHKILASFSMISFHWQHATWLIDSLGFITLFVFYSKDLFSNKLTACQINFIVHNNQIVIWRQVPIVQNSMDVGVYILSSDLHSHNFQKSSILQKCLWHVFDENYFLFHNSNWVNQTLIKYFVCIQGVEMTVLIAVTSWAWNCLSRPNLGSSKVIVCIFFEFKIFIECLRIPRRCIQLRLSKKLGVFSLCLAPSFVLLFGHPWNSNVCLVTGLLERERGRIQEWGVIPRHRENLIFMSKEDLDITINNKLVQTNWA